MRILSKYVIAGMELASELKEVNLDSGIIINEDIIKTIKNNNIDYLDIKTNSEFDTINDSIKRLIENILASDNVDEMHDLAIFLTQLVKESSELKFDLSIYLKNNYNHLVNTIILSALLAKKYNEITEKDLQVELENVIYAAIIEDIGRRAKKEETLKFLKDKYSDDLIECNRLIPDRDLKILDNYDSKYHPLYGYFFCKYYKTSESVKMAVLLHHEKENGTNSLFNTPLSTVDNEEYGRIAKIIKLADLFDIIVKNNCLENPDNPYINLGKSIDTIVSSSFVNARLANILKTIVPIYQVGMQVLLSDGTVGIIKANDANDYNTPTVVDLNGKEIDLRDENITVLKQSD